MKFHVYSGGKECSHADLAACFGGGGETGVFESMRTYNGVVFRLDEHLERLRDSARTAGLWSLPPSPDLKEEIRLAAGAFRKYGGTQGDIFIRLTFYGGKTHVIVGERRHPPELYRSGVVLRATPVRSASANAGAPQAKTSSYQSAVLAALQPSSGAYEWLFLDRNGFISEVSIGNVFMIKKGVLRTPPSAGILNGVTRRFVIECASPAGITAEEVPLSRHDIYNADEVFLTNTSWEILPVREVDGRSVGVNVPGPLTLKIHHLFKQRIVRECQRSKSDAL